MNHSTNLPLNEWQFFLVDESATEQLGRALSEVLTAPLSLYMRGELGAGKTTLVRGLLKGLGHQGSTKSPTYTLVEPYQLDDIAVYHFDLYRLADPEELEYIGIREYQDEASILIFEWPDKGLGMIPKADLEIHLDYSKQGRLVKIQDLSGKLANDWNLDEFLCQNEN